MTLLRGAVIETTWVRAGAAGEWMKAVQEFKLWVEQAGGEDPVDQTMLLDHTPAFDQGDARSH